MDLLATQVTTAREGETRPSIEREMKPLEAGVAERKPRLGFLGVGWIGRHRMEAVVRSGLAEVAVIADTSREMAEAAAAAAPGEAERIRVACRIAEKAFLEGTRQLREGMKEYEAAAAFRAPLCAVGSRSGVQRADGFILVASGLNSASAYGAYARSRDRELEPGDFVMVHCNSYVDGYWTNVTRTFVMGEAGPQKLEMYGAVHAALRAAMDVIRPGAMAADVDTAARESLASRGFGNRFKHAAGHGVGFAAIDHNAPPRLHPASRDRLEAGMIFNLEPAIYVEGYGGLRHCDMVRVTETGVEVLTPFQSSIEHLVVRSSVSEEALGAESAAAMV